jgi:hypothetical protein
VEHRAFAFDPENSLAVGVVPDSWLPEDDLYPRGQRPRQWPYDFFQTGTLTESIINPPSGPTHPVSWLGGWETPPRKAAPTQPLHWFREMRPEDLTFTIAPPAMAWMAAFDYRHPAPLQFMYEAHGFDREITLFTLPPGISWKSSYDNPPKGHRPRQPEYYSFVIGTLEQSLYTAPPPLAWHGNFDNPPAGHRPRQPEQKPYAGVLEPSLHVFPPKLVWMLKFDYSPPVPRYRQQRGWGTEVYVQVENGAPPERWSPLITQPMFLPWRPRGSERTDSVEPSLFTQPPPVAWAGVYANPPTSHRPRQSRYETGALPLTPSLFYNPVPVKQDFVNPAGHRSRQSVNEAFVMPWTASVIFNPVPTTVGELPPKGKGRLPEYVAFRIDWNTATFYSLVPLATYDNPPAGPRLRQPDMEALALPPRTQRHEWANPTGNYALPPYPATRAQFESLAWMYFDQTTALLLPITSQDELPPYGRAPNQEDYTAYAGELEQSLYTIPPELSWIWSFAPPPLGPRWAQVWDPGTYSFSSVVLPPPSTTRGPFELRGARSMFMGSMGPYQSA